MLTTTTSPLGIHSTTFDNHEPPLDHRRRHSIFSFQNTSTTTNSPLSIYQTTTTAFFSLGTVSDRRQRRLGFWKPLDRRISVSFFLRVCKPPWIYYFFPNLSRNPRRFFLIMFTRRRTTFRVLKNQIFLFFLTVLRPIHSLVPMLMVLRVYGLVGFERGGCQICDGF